MTFRITGCGAQGFTSWPVRYVGRRVCNALEPHAQCLSHVASGLAKVVCGCRLVVICFQLRSMGAARVYYSVDTLGAKPSQRGDFQTASRAGEWSFYGASWNMQDRSNPALEMVPSRQHGCCSAIKGEGRNVQEVLGACHSVTESAIFYQTAAEHLLIAISGAR
ncbi:hypothetical protein COCVIDRAFT_20314 [Bipolaris victoriae FI3]|uniref:Uncharacterized protein n=1 Tax=Bipolaris victoriae (strain FI3) TaxID=930091 RepID=W7DUR9_BIPV3|nr:hypothetical protein COCVIDRAFT_20314 [Bipolaris victoriae FI3]